MRASRRYRAAVTAVIAAGAMALDARAEVSRRPSAPRADQAPDGATIQEAEDRFAIPAAWIRAIIRVESGDDPHAVSAAGAMGLMQIMPATWAVERVRLGLRRDPFNRRDNILAGADFLRAMRDRYGLAGMLAAYNAGPQRYEDYRLRGRPLPAETVAYVTRLAPLISGQAGDLVVAATQSDPLAWTRAALFTARPDDPATTGSGDVAGAATPPPNARSAAADAGAKPPSDDPPAAKADRPKIEPPAVGLFIPLAGRPKP